MTAPLSAVACSTCGANLLGKWIAMRMRHAAIELDWQVASGLCVDCHLTRFRAVHEYERAADEARLLAHMFPPPYVLGQIPMPVAAAMKRVQAADERCVELGMWSAERTTKRPPSFYGG